MPLLSEHTSEGHWSKNQYAKFDQNQMKPVGELVFLVKSWRGRTNEDVGRSVISKAHLSLWLMRAKKGFQHPTYEGEIISIWLLNKNCFEIHCINASMYFIWIWCFRGHASTFILHAVCLWLHMIIHCINTTFSLVFYNANLFETY